MTSIIRYLINKIKKPMKPPKIILSRKSKDEQGLESIKGGGEYTIRSRGKITSPTNPSKTLSRGSVVSVKPKTETVTTATSNPPTYKSTTIDVPTSKFVSGDFQKGVKDRPTTMALGKQLKEDPKKTASRMDAQSKGETSYTGRKGQAEYSGRIDKGFEKKKINMPVPSKPTYKSETITKNVTSVKSPVSNAPAGRGGVTKRGHVEWLDRKSENKAFTSKPNTGGRTKIKWTGSKVKRY